MLLDAEYYISRTLIPPLERIFNLVGANVRQWYDEMPKMYIRGQREVQEGVDRLSNTTTLHSFMRSRTCTVCGVQRTDGGMESCSGPVDGVRVLSDVSFRSRRIRLCNCPTFAGIGDAPFADPFHLFKLLRHSIRGGNMLRLS